MRQPFPESLELGSFSTTCPRSDPSGISPEIEWREIGFAVDAADHDSFHRAAADLRLKQSTLSRHIREMAAGA
jgi:hypothetical protein